MKPRIGDDVLIKLKVVQIIETEEGFQFKLRYKDGVLDCITVLEEDLAEYNKEVSHAI